VVVCVCARVYVGYVLRVCMLGVFLFFCVCFVFVVVVVFVGGVICLFR